MKKLNVGFLLLIPVLGHAAETEPKYNSSSRILTIPEVEMEGSGTVTDVKFKLNAAGVFDFISLSEGGGGSNSENIPVYEESEGFLTIPSVKIDNEVAYDAMLQLNEAGSFFIVGYENEPSTTCTTEMITREKFEQITQKMSLEQIRDIMGCRGSMKPIQLHSLDYTLEWDAREDNDTSSTSIEMIFLQDGPYRWNFDGANGDEILCLRSLSFVSEKGQCFNDESVH